VADILIWGHRCLPLHLGRGHGRYKCRLFRWKRAMWGGRPV